MVLYNCFLCLVRELILLLEGRLELTIGEETRVVEPRSMFIIPPNIPHRAVAIDGPAVVMDVFSPIREDYAKLMHGDNPAD